MGIPSKTLTHSQRGFTLVELLTAMAISAGLLLMVAMLFKVGLWEVRHSSGRIEIVRRGRQCMDNVQRYLVAACKPNSSGAQEAISYPVTFSDDLHQAPESRVQFFTPIDFLVSSGSPTARQLQQNPVYHSYEIAAVPGPTGAGQDVVLRKYLPPANPGEDPVDQDLSVAPRYLGRDLGIPDPTNPSLYNDGLVIRYLRPGAVEVEVNVSSSRISDDTNRNAIEANTPMVVTMNSIIQLPYYSNQ